MVPARVTRRRFVGASMTGVLLSGCLGSNRERQGVIDADDISFNRSSSGDVEFKNRRNDKYGFGVQVSTRDSMDDSVAISNLEVSIPGVSRSDFLMIVDIAEMDDDAEVELRFCGESSCRSVYIGNEYKSRFEGVLATEPGEGFEMEQPFSTLPLSNDAMESPPEHLQDIEIRIGDGDIMFTIWRLMIKFDDYSVVIV